MSERSIPRLFVDSALGADIVLDGAPAHYLVNVMRRKAGDPVLLFNGRDGEWRYSAASLGRGRIALAAAGQVRAQTVPADLELLFAPLKKARTDYTAQKATELGAARIVPVLTARTIAERVRTDRLRANAVEAAEQCGLLWVPQIGEPVELDAVLAAQPPGRILIFCDESAASHSPVETLGRLPAGPKSVLIGPEGGFTEREAAAIRSVDGAVAISLGPRIMRADTAAVAALSLVQAVCGDWNG